MSRNPVTPEDQPTIESPAASRPVEPEETAAEPSVVAPAPDAADIFDPPAGVPRRKSILGTLARAVSRMGQDVISLAIRRTPEPQAEGDVADPTDVSRPPGPRPVEKARQKVGMLHGVAERLRGAADTYVAAKLDELEARVDVKLDEIEQRIDKKILELHDQLKAIRDQELRHRLRILKITLAFTALVGVISLVYKLLAKSLG